MLIRLCILTDPFTWVCLVSIALHIGIQICEWPLSTSLEAETSIFFAYWELEKNVDIAQKEVSGFKTLLKQQKHKQKKLHF